MLRTAPGVSLCAGSDTRELHILPAQTLLPRKVVYAHTHLHTLKGVS